MKSILLILFISLSKSILCQKCDLIIFNNTSETEVIIKEITENVIKFKKCNFIDGPDYSVFKNEIFKIKFANGTSMLMKHDLNEQKSDNLITEEEKKLFYNLKIEVKYSELSEEQKRIIYEKEPVFTLYLLDKSIVKSVKIMQIKSKKLICAVGKRGTFVNYKNSEIDYIENENGFKILFNQ